MARRKSSQAKSQAERSVGLAFTFDTGMLIALERKDQSAWKAFKAITARELVPVVPSAALPEWWRGRTDLREEILAALVIEDLAPVIWKAAGEALGVVKGSTVVDAVVMASASLRGGGIVYTSDPKDLGLLQSRFPTVRVLDI